jgi:DNA-binding IclR family transcriptional regulator
MTRSKAEEIESSFEANSDFATTLAKGIAILECFSAQQPTLNTSDISARTGFKRPTVARLASTLSELGYLSKSDGGFRLSLRPLALLHPILASLSVRQLARPMMQELASDLRGTVSIGALDGYNLIYVETARSGDMGPHIPDIGSSVPVLRTALGRALFYMQTPFERAALETLFARETPDLWQEMRGTLMENLKSCEQRGFTVAYGDLIPQTYAVGTPLFEDPHFGSFAINCGVPAFRLRSGELEQEIAPRLIQLAASIRAVCASSAAMAPAATQANEPRKKTRRTP